MENQTHEHTGEHHKTDEHQKGKKRSQEAIERYVQIGFILLLSLAIIFNLGKIYGGDNTGIISSVAASDILPIGVPAVYGKALDVSYDDVSVANPQLADATIAKLAQYEDQELTKVQLDRYITIASAISCEYCCGAKSIIFPNGERACGCAHSFAMRGLAKYLLINNPEMKDEEILAELGKWKVLFFPGIHEQKAKVLEAQGIDSTDYINLASNKYRGIEQGKTNGGAMVGGC